MAAPAKNGKKAARLAKNLSRAAAAPSTDAPELPADADVLVSGILVQGLINYLGTRPINEAGQLYTALLTQTKKLDGTPITVQQLPPG